jgi:transposase-like protein
MDKFERAEAEYNKHYDPCAEKCPHCGAEDSIIEKALYEGDNVIYYCGRCGCEITD